MIDIPFRHVCIDGFLEPRYAKTALESFPPEDSSVWKTPENVHTHAKSVLRGLKYEQFGWSVRPIFDYLASAITLTRLADMFSIAGLMPDPYYSEGGYHRIGRGGFLDIHADFSHSDITGLERRLNLIIYLNEGWQPEWGGELKLYAKDLTPMASYEPLFNRAVIFETGATSYHGHPKPLDCPEGEYRKSIALYYYTLPRPERVRRRAFFPTDPTFEHRPT